MGDDDARKLGEGFAFFEANDLRNLETGQAVCRVERSDYDFNLTVPLPELPDEAEMNERRLAVITGSRKEHGTPRADVETLLARTRAASTPAKPDDAAAPSSPKPQPARAAEATPPPPPHSTAISGEASLPSPTDDVEEESQHNAIKERIRVRAEALDFTVTFEEMIPPSKSRVDVVLRRGDRVVACEISVKSPVEYEIRNIYKCLNGGFAHVALISAIRSKLEHIRERFQTTATDEQSARVAFYTPETFISQLHDWAIDDPEGAKVEQGKPRKRKIPLGGRLLSDDERQAREREMLRHIKEAMGRNPRPPV